MFIEPFGEEYTVHFHPQALYSEPNCTTEDTLRLGCVKSASQLANPATTSRWPLSPASTSRPAPTGLYTGRMSELEAAVSLLGW